MRAASFLVLGILLQFHPVGAMEKEGEGAFIEKKITPSLPHEMFSHVLSFLPLEDFNLFRRTCKDLNEEAKRSIYYLPKTTKKNLNILRSFLPSDPKHININFERLVLLISRTPLAGKWLFQAGKSYYSPLVKQAPKVNHSRNLEAQFKDWQVHGFALYLAEILFHKKATTERRAILEGNKKFFQSHKTISVWTHFFPIVIPQIKGKPLVENDPEHVALERVFLDLQKTLAPAEILKAFKSQHYTKAHRIYEVYGKKMGPVFPHVAQVKENITALFRIIDTRERHDPLVKKDFNRCLELEGYLEKHHEDMKKKSSGTQETSEGIAYLLQIKEKLNALRLEIANKYRKTGLFWYGAYYSSVVCREDTNANWTMHEAILRGKVEEKNQKWFARIYQIAGTIYVTEAKKIAHFLKAARIYEEAGEALKASNCYLCAALCSKDPHEKAEYTKKSGALSKTAREKF